MSSLAESNSAMSDHTVVAPVQPPSPQAPSKFVVTMRKVYRPLGFNKGYNFPLFVIFAGAMLGFVFARVSYLNVSGDLWSSFKENAVPGTWYWYHGGHYRIGITLHLATCLPCGFLMVFQFVPKIRHKFLIFHRINGYVVIILTFLSNAGALMILRRAFGGGLDTQSALGLLALLVTIAICMAYYNIKRLQIDQHRAWMLRAMFYMGVIITTRIVMYTLAAIASVIGGYHEAQKCAQILYVYRQFNIPVVAAQQIHPGCFNGTSPLPNQWVVVDADYYAKFPERTAAGLDISFGSAVWFALFLHIIGVEIYLRLTPAEGERLRTVSYERQLEAGYKYPGSAGLTTDRWGDAPVWKPQPKQDTPVEKAGMNNLNPSDDK